MSKLNDGLKRPRTRKRLDHVWQRIGRIREKSRGAAAHYDIDVIADDSGEKARAVTWERRPLAGTMITHPGVYCLRTNVQDWDEETLWRTYTSLTDVEAVFRSLKSELGLRPIFHRTQGRSDGHLFITVIAYQMVQTIRRRLGEKGERESWASLRAILEGQQRVPYVANQLPNLASNPAAGGSPAAARVGRRGRHRGGARRDCVRLQRAGTGYQGCRFTRRRDRRYRRMAGRPT